jgi:hypothetical protein
LPKDQPELGSPSPASVEKELCSQFTSIVNLVLINSKGYVQRVELTQASAPARSDEVGRSLGLISLWCQEFLGRIKQTAAFF